MTFKSTIPDDTNLAGAVPTGKVLASTIVEVLFRVIGSRMLRFWMKRSLKSFKKVVS